MPRDPPVTITVRPCRSLTWSSRSRVPGRRTLLDGRCRVSVPARAPDGWCPGRCGGAAPTIYSHGVTSIQLLRHATVVVELDGQRILVDPMLDAAGARPPIDNTPEPRDNPLVELPPGTPEALDGLTGAIVTHLHADHLDDEGAAFLARAGVPVQGQAGDLETLAQRSIPATELGSAPFGGVQVHRTGGRHAH